ncbi:Bacterial transcriptional activator domain protein [compost metagenome]
MDYPWCISEREKYRESFFQLSKQWCQFQIEIGLYEAAADRIRYLLNKSILDEEAHEMLLNIYFLQNDRVSFIKHYQKLSDLLRTELGLEPNESIRRLYEKVLKK